MRTLILLSLLSFGCGGVYLFGGQFQGEVWRVLLGMGLFGLMGLALGSVADNLLLWFTRLVGGKV